MALKEYAFNDKTPEQTFFRVPFKEYAFNDETTELYQSEIAF